MYKLLMSSMVLMLALFLGACSTVSGVGEDIQKVGEVITDGADDVKTELKKEPESKAY